MSVMNNKGAHSHVRQNTRNERGAALILSIAITVVLFAIGVTFLTVSNVELQTATNVTNTVRVDLLADGANAIAIAHLNQDFFRNPEATSLDHSWRSFFNGSWAVGKPWARVQDGSGPWLPQLNIGRLDQIAGFEVNIQFENDLHIEPLFRGPRTADWAFVPRTNPNGILLYAEFGDFRIIDPLTGLEVALADLNAQLVAANHPPLIAYDPNGGGPGAPQFNPFVTPNLYGAVPPAVVSRPGGPGVPTNAQGDPIVYPAEAVNAFTDVDNDGDGLRDSIWMPIPIDRFSPSYILQQLEIGISQQSGDRVVLDPAIDYVLFGIDNNLNGLIDEQPDNGLDDDGDDQIDFEFLRNPDGTFVIDPGTGTRIAETGPDGSPLADLDESLEAGVFVYWGGSDGLDNNGDGIPDDPAEQKYFLTAPLPGIVIPVDLDGDGVPGDLVPDIDGNPVPLRVQLPGQIRVRVFARNSLGEVLVDGNGLPILTVQPIGPSDVDVIDNDHNLIVNDYYTYAYIGPNTRGDYTDNGVTLGAPPFRHGGFEFIEGPSAIGNWGRPVLNTAANSVLAAGNNFYEQWQHPGNWPNEDQDLFAVPRRQAYRDINTTVTFDGTAGPTFIPAEGRIGDGTSNSIGNIGFINYNQLANIIRITHSGEPVTDIAGRAAIHIADEAGKVNLNTAGAYAYNSGYDEPAGGAPLGRSLNLGATTHEYETRMLPGIEDANALSLQGLLSGGPGGETIQTLDPLRDPFRYDISFPGYGRVDDNANAFFLAMTGTDSSGSGLIDEGLYLPRLSRLTRNALEGTAVPASGTPAWNLMVGELQLSDFTEYYRRLGVLEGIDEPQERRPFNPYRNLIAEGRRLPHLQLSSQPGALDNYRDADLDGDDATSEIGELGDRVLADRRDWTAIVTGAANRQTLARLTTTFSSDREIGLVPTREGYRALNRLDYNYATPQQIASALLINSEAAPVTTRNGLFSDAIVRNFAEGLRRGDTGVLAPQGILNGGSEGLPADPVLRALQMAADIVDMRDRDHRATRLTTENYDRVVDPTRPDEELDKAPWPPRALLNNRERIDLSEDPTDEVKLMPLEEIEQYLEDTYENIRRLHSPDTWWSSPNGAGVVGRNPNRAAAGLDETIPVPEEKMISYTVQGREAIRINELMVRPVRRIEAEAVTTGSNSPGLSATPATGITEPLLPLRNTPQILNYVANLCLDGGTIIPCFDPITGVVENPMTTIMPRFQARRRVLNTAEQFGPLAYDGPNPASTWNFVSSNGLMGESAGFRTTNPQFQYEHTGTGILNQYPNSLEFIITEAEGLPTGRYYLKVNVTDPVTGQPTVPLSSATGSFPLLEYAIKYVAVDENGQPVENSIIADDMSNPNTTDTRWHPVPDEWISGNYGEGVPQGWVFLDGQPKLDPNAPLSRYWLDGGPILYNGAIDTSIAVNVPALGVPEPASGETHTIVIPPFGPNSFAALAPFRVPQDAGGNPLPATNDQQVLSNRAFGYAINIAFRKNADFVEPDPANPLPLAINFLDFSQEPDHEWVELANVSDEPVDIAGWRLEVGIPDRPEVPRDPHKSIWRVPDNQPYEIAPGGKVLLSFSSSRQDPTNPLNLEWEPFDRYLSSISNYGLTQRNGIGLARDNVPVPPAPLVPIIGVTVPPIADQSPNGGLFPGLFNLPQFADATGNVFWRENGLDYIDTNGDGVSMTSWFNDILNNLPGVPTDAEFAFLNELDTDNVMDEYAVRAFLDTSTPPPFLANLEAFARIIPLENEYLFREVPDSPTSPGVRIQDITDVNTLAHFVLRGGVLPNYPEHDGIDNDGDGGYYLIPGDATTYVRGTLESDMVDNNLSGLIDEIGEGIDEGRGYVTNFSAVPSFRWRQYGSGTYENPLGDRGVLPLFFAADRQVYLSEICVACPYGPGFDPLVSTDFLSSGGIPVDPAFPGVVNTPVRRLGDSSFDPFGPGAFLDPQDALYLGSNADPPDWKAFVERRWNPGDNVIVTLYDGDGGLADQATYREYDVINRTIDDIAPSPYVNAAGNPAVLDPEYPSMWLPNHMNLDFYRSLERKHPLHAGDRFGTSNRWEATDGAYDDWAESMSWFEVEVDNIANNFPHAKGILRPRFFPGAGEGGIIQIPRVLSNRRLFSHAMYASPLRKNTTTRLMENPADAPGLILALQASTDTDVQDLVNQFLGGNILDPATMEDYQSIPPISPNLWRVANSNRQATQFPMGDFYRRSIGDPADPIAFQDRDWSLRHPRNSVLNRNYVSPGELTRLPALQFLEVLQKAPILASGQLGLDLLRPQNNVFSTTTTIDPLQAGAPAPVGRLDPSLRMGLLGQDTGSSDLGGVNLHQAATDTMATSSLVLTVGQADFTPIGPYPADLPSAALPGGDVDELAAWKIDLSVPPVNTIEAPGLWTPVTYFEMPNFDLPGVVPNERFPNYPTFYDGRSFVPSNDASFVARRILPLINFDWLYPGGAPGALAGASVSSTGAPLGNGAPPFDGLPEGALAARWPLEQRTVMYVAQNRSLGGGATTVQRAAESNVNAKAEAIWSWDANDGLENGEYILYIGTHYPGLADRLSDGQAVTTTAGAATGLPELQSIFDATGGIPSGDTFLDPRAAAFLAVDPESSNLVRIRPRLAIDVITDPSRARGVRFGGGPETAPGIVPPDEWNPSLVYRPRSDGYIFVGAEAEGQWRPQVVRVTNNFLAIRVRNEGNEREIGAISHIVLAPRKRTPGKINVNTAAQTVAVPANPSNPNNAEVQFFNSLIGLPGVVDIGGLPTASPTTNTSLNNPVAPPIGAFASGEVLPPRAFPQSDGPQFPYQGNAQTQALQAMALLQLGLVERPDGRYFSHISELAREETRYGNPLDPTNPAEALHPLSNQRDPERRFDEIASRFSRMSNLLSVRSDIFEIIVTVQAGYGLDLNSDGRFNYRSNDEFITTAETSTRLVYERRTPADRSDEGRGRN